MKRHKRRREKERGREGGKGAEELKESRSHGLGQIHLSVSQPPPLILLCPCSVNLEHEKALWLEMRLWDQRDWVQIPVPPHTCCVLRGRHGTSPCVSFIISKMKIIDVPSSKGPVRI